MDLATEEVRHEAVIHSNVGNPIGFVTNSGQFSLVRTHLIVEQERLYPLARWNGGVPDFLPWPPYGEGARFSVASPNASEQRLVFHTASGAIVSLDGETGGIRSSRAHGQFITGISFSPDGRLIYAGGLDGFARCWDVASMELVGRPMRSQLMAIHSLGLSPDGRRMVTGSVDGRVTIWDAESQRELGMIDFSDEMRRAYLLSFLTNDILLVRGQNIQPDRDREYLWQVCRAPREVADR